MMARNQSAYSMEQISELMNDLRPLVQNLLPNLIEITAGDLITYFSAESPYGDITTIDDVLQSRWLLIHEMVELSELKRMGLEINDQILLEHMEEVNRAHITAAEIEFKAAEDDRDYIERRIKDVDNWIGDDELSDDLRERCVRLKERYS